MGDWVAAFELLQKHCVGAKEEVSTCVDAKAYAAVGAQQRQGDVNFVDLIRKSLAAGGAVTVPDELGPLRFESPKIARVQLKNRGKGVVATADIAVGELLIMSRPLSLVSSG